MSRQEVLALLVGIAGNLVALMSGILAIAFTIVGLIWREAPAGRVFLGLALLGALLSPVLAWRDQYRESQGLRERIAELAAVDYSYGLVLDDIQLGLDLGNAANTFEFRLVFKNAVKAPLRFVVEKIEQKIEGITVVSASARPAVITSGDRRTWFPGAGFSKDAYHLFRDRTSGVLVYSALYGPPDRPFSRHATKTLLLNVFKKTDKDGNPTVAITWVSDAETDEPTSR